ncbi:MAG TPA: cupin domain-containing protein [Thermoanaerobaculia bacterium]|nr:cupin domain-containing protein [Thermoanaerobaculia bacterium]
MTPVQIVRNAEADTLWVVRDRIRFMGEVASTDLSVLEVEVPPGSGTPPHVHASPEIFRVLAGEITFGIFDDGPPREVVAGEGAVVTVSPRAPHNYRNASAAPATMLVVAERSMVEFFRDLGRREAPPAGPPSDAEIAEVIAACARHDISILGGPPA